MEIKQCIISFDECPTKEITSHKYKRIVCRYAAIILLTIHLRNNLYNNKHKIFPHMISTVFVVVAFYELTIKTMIIVTGS